MLAETLLPSNQCHVLNLRIPINALMLLSGYLLDMLVRWSPMIFLSVSESTTARSLPCCKQDSRASSHSLATDVPANTRKHESSTSNQPESHVDPVKPITKGNRLHWVSLFLPQYTWFYDPCGQEKIFYRLHISLDFVNVNAKQTFPFLFFPGFSGAKHLPFGPFPLPFSLARDRACNAHILDINVVINWQLSKYRWPVALDRTRGSGVDPSRSSIFWSYPLTSY